jgi:hypothetical protein
MRFTIRDLLWLMIVCGSVLGWWRWWYSLPVSDGRIQGIVLVAGKPVDSGRVYLHSSDGQFRGGQVAQGFFLLECVPVGKYRLTFEGDSVPPNRFPAEVSDTWKAMSYTFDIRP